MLFGYLLPADFLCLPQLAEGSRSLLVAHAETGATCEVTALWRLSDGSLAALWRLSGGSLAALWRLSGGSVTGSVTAL